MFFQNNGFKNNLKKITFVYKSSKRVVCFEKRKNESKKTMIYTKFTGLFSPCLL